MGPDGRTVEARLQTLVNRAKDDIKSSANVCDTYSKKKLLVRVLTGQAWEARLAGCIETFTSRKQEFEFALAIHTAKAVDSVKTTLEAMDQKFVWHPRPDSLFYDSNTSIDSKA